MKQYRQLKIKDVLIKDGFFSPKLETNFNSIIPAIYKQCKDTGRIDAWKWKEGMPNKPHVYWDSDVAKWIESASYSLIHNPDKEIESKIDEIVVMMEKAQLPDGYLNSYYLNVEPQNRFTFLRNNHELYCAGHLIEAAVAYYEATGKDNLLNIMRRYADLIDKTFSPEEGKIHGYDGHQEIELALVKLYGATTEKRYLNLAKYFLDERGKQPFFFDIEAEKRAEKINVADPFRYKNLQAHLPVRHQKTAEGHAVRCCYMLAGMAESAVESGDESLLDACREMWKSIVDKRLYITGGVGSSRNGEAFTFDYDLPNNEAYAETCAAIALVFFAGSMLNIDGCAEYADTMETAIYNGILSGVSLDGKKFFYENPLEAVPEKDSFYKSQRGGSVRQEWFGCACCPPNVARLLSSIEKYIYSLGDDEIRINLYVGNEANFKISGVDVKIKMETGYPWNGKIAVQVSPEKESEFALSMRMPGWCEKASLLINGEKNNWVKLLKNGYMNIRRHWCKGDKIELDFDMPVRFVRANPNVRGNIGKVASRRGPVVYCLEEADNGKNLALIFLNKMPKPVITEMIIQGTSFPAIKLNARKIREISPDSPLYTYEKPELENFTATAIPYFLWANRNSSPAEMTVWINE